MLLTRKQLRTYLQKLMNESDDQVKVLNSLFSNVTRQEISGDEYNVYSLAILQEFRKLLLGATTGFGNFFEKICYLSLSQTSLFSGVLRDLNEGINQPFADCIHEDGSNVLYSIKFTKRPYSEDLSNVYYHKVASCIQQGINSGTLKHDTDYFLGLIAGVIDFKTYYEETEKNWVIKSGTIPILAKVVTPNLDAPKFGMDQTLGLYIKYSKNKTNKIIKNFNKNIFGRNNYKYDKDLGAYIAKDKTDIPTSSKEISNINVYKESFLQDEFNSKDIKINLTPFYNAGDFQSSKNNILQYQNNKELTNSAMVSIQSEFQIKDDPSSNPEVNVPRRNTPTLNSFNSFIGDKAAMIDATKSNFKIAQLTTQNLSKRKILTGLSDGVHTALSGIQYKTYYNAAPKTPIPKNWPNSASKIYSDDFKQAFYAISQACNNFLLTKIKIAKQKVLAVRSNASPGEIEKANQSIILLQLMMSEFAGHISRLDTNAANAVLRKYNLEHKILFGGKNPLFDKVYKQDNAAKALRKSLPQFKNENYSLEYQESDLEDYPIENLFQEIKPEDTDELGEMISGYKEIAGYLDDIIDFIDSLQPVSSTVLENRIYQKILLEILKHSKK